MKTVRGPKPDLHPEKLLRMASASMRAQFVVMRTSGKTDAPSPEKLYGFRAAEVAELHFYKRGVGSGLWYRLKDGRVIDARGKRSRRASSWYARRPG